MLAKLLEHRANVDLRREIGVTKEEFLIGRGPDCDLRLAVPAVSRHHCLIRIRGGEATLTDLGSTLDEGVGAFTDTAAVMVNLDLVVTTVAQR